MASRLSIAIEDGHVVLPEGQLLVLGATVESDLSPLEPARAMVLSRYADAHAQANAAGYGAVTAIDGQFDGAVVFVPRARDAARALLRFARQRTSGPIIVDGPKTNGVDALFKACRARADVSDAFAKAHGKTFTVTAGDFSDWPDMASTKAEDGWWRGPGAFSADGIDRASQCLVDALPEQLAGHVVDLGAGWGFLSRAIAGRDGVAALDVVEIDHLALDAARRNVSDDRATFHWADARTWRPGTPVDHVVTNPPFHTSRKAEPELGRAFIRAAAAMLKPKGSLWLVANRHLPYERTLEDAFHFVQTLTPNPSFKIFHAKSPKKLPRG
ncbi:MAG: methyltransferase [Pseudomonadota bacterium]